MAFMLPRLSCLEQCVLLCVTLTPKQSKMLTDRFADAEHAMYGSDSMWSLCMQM